MCSKVLWCTTKTEGITAMQKYFLGVDGGNTKTDYLLCTVEGDFVDVYRTETCSHERFENGYEDMEQVMGKQLTHLLNRNGIDIESIASAGLGLAGADLPSQVTELKKRVKKIGLTCYGLSNDGILGIKAASDSGVGLCAVNGTGTVVVGIDKKGEILQVGGVGPLSGDYAGGGYISRQIISLLYDFYYRCGEDSIMFSQLMDLLKADPADMLTLVSNHALLSKHTVDIIQIGSNAAVAGDTVARGIFDTVGVTIGRSAAGCIRSLSFEGLGTSQAPIDIVLVGSIWHKIPYEGMQDSFMQTAMDLTGKHCRCITLQSPAATGGVLWAKEIADGTAVSAEYRKKLLETITIDRYETFAFKK